MALDAQTQWVEPSSPSSGAGAGSSEFHLTLSLKGAPAGATVRAVLYPRLPTRDALEATVREGPRTSPVSSSAPEAVKSLGASSTFQGARTLALAVEQGASSGGEELGLGCASGPQTAPGTCTGVYPVSVELSSRDGRVLTSFTTFLTYVRAKSAHRLAFAWVLPVAARTSLEENAKTVAQAMAPLPSSSATAMETLAAALRAWPSVPVTLDASPASLTALSRSGAAGREAVTTLASLSGDPSVHELLPAPYAPADLVGLEAAGEPTEVVAQLAAGETVLVRLGMKPVPGAPWVGAMRSPGGMWPRALHRVLERVGTREVVVPNAALAPRGTPGTATHASTFGLDLGPRAGGATPRAAAADTLLDGQFVRGPRDPALAASQILADLALVHFERPNTVARRGVIAAPRWHGFRGASFYETLLSGLEGNPVVAPVTLSGFFSSVDPAGSRSLAPGVPRRVFTRRQASALSRARVRLSDFGSSVAGDPALLAGLDHVLLIAESSNLDRRAQARAVGTLERLLDAQLALVSFATGKTVTLTAHTGWVPLTVVSRAPYAVVGTVSVHGERFGFPRRSTFPKLRLDHATNPLRVYVVARSTGDLPLRVVLTTPNGRLVIARGLLTVRSTGASIVGVVLSAVALLVLLSWWARTWWRGRRRRRHRPRAVPSGET